MKRFIFFVLISCSVLGAMEKHVDNFGEVSIFISTLANVESGNDILGYARDLFDVREKLFCILFARTAAKLLEPDLSDAALLKLTREYIALEEAYTNHRKEFLDFCYVFSTN